MIFMHRPDAGNLFRQAAQPLRHSVAHYPYLRLIGSVICFMACGWLLLDANSSSAALMHGQML